MLPRLHFGPDAGEKSFAVTLLRCQLDYTHTASNGRLVGDVERIWEEVFVTTEVLSRKLLEG